MPLITRILSIATALFLGGGFLFLILGPLLNDSWKEMMLTDLAVTCIFIGIITAIGGALCDLLRKKRTKHHETNAPTDPSA